MKMITLSALLILLGFLDGSAMAKNQNGAWRLLAQGNFLSAYVEKAAYRNDSSDHFFIRVRLQNKTNGTIGVDLNDYFRVFYPNQWGVYQRAQREAVDEERITPTKLNEQSRQKLLAAYDKKDLAMIGPRASVDYFREFNASTIKDLEASKGYFLIVSMHGQINATDGKTAEMLTLEWQKGTDMAATDVVIPYPIQWKSIPADGLIIKTQSWIPVLSPATALSSSPNRQHYRHAYYLYQERAGDCASCYIPLLITTAPLEDTQKDQEIADCIPIVTYERDSIWQVLSRVTVRRSDIEDCRQEDPINYIFRRRLLVRLSASRSQHKAV